MVDNGIYKRINYKTFFSICFEYKWIKKYINSVTLQPNINIKFLTFSF